MRNVKPLSSKKRRAYEARLRVLEDEYRRFALSLSKAGYLWNGTLVRMKLTCGRPCCTCHRDKARRHGPYAYWTTKVKGKTVSCLLAPEEADLYEEWIHNRRRLQGTIKKMHALSKRVAPMILQMGIKSQPD